MSQGLAILFRLHALVSLLFGLPLLLFPGHLLAALGWAPIDPILSRVAGAAIIALGWSSVRARLTDSPQITLVLIEMDAVFSVIGTLGVLRHLLVSYYLPAVDFLFGVLLAFSAAWIVFWIRERSSTG